MLDAQLVVLVAWVGAHALGDELEELGQPLEEDDLVAELAQQATAPVQTETPNVQVPST